MNTYATAKTFMVSKCIIPVMISLTICALVECAVVLAVTGRIL